MLSGQLTYGCVCNFAVYLLDEIADMARQSPEAATAIAEAVQKKLAAKNPVVKFKASWLMQWVPAAVFS
jgi:hypothetical protein